MSVSTIPAVKRALMTLFEGVTEPSTEVWRNRPTEEHQFQENVYIGNARNAVEWGQIGRKPPTRIEDYTIAVDVEVYRDGPDSADCEDRLWEIVAQLELALEGATTLGDQVMEALFSRAAQTATGGSSGWLCVAAFEVAVKARI